jgi:CubicO group peptidase (beta-lactamase class C family)
MKKAILLLLLLPLAALAQRSHTDLLDKYMKAQENINGFSGTVLVAQNGKIIYEEAFGLADRELNVKNNLQSVYQIASLTKQFTACAILQLVDTGKLRVTDKLSQYFPDFPKGDSITIHMLLNHTSGIKTTGEMDGYNDFLTKDSMLVLIKRQTLVSSPGTNYHYSNLGYFLLGMIVEKISRESYSEYLYDNIFLKVGMKNTLVNNWDTILTNRAKGYQKTATGWRNNSYLSLDEVFGGGSLLSNAEDLYKWSSALFSNKIIPAGSVKKMLTPNLNKYGYGIDIDTFLDHRNFWHTGQLNGFASYLGTFPDDSISVVVLSNNGSPCGNIGSTLAAIVFGTEVIPPYYHVESEIDTTIIAKYIGQYQLSGNDKLEIIKIGGKLFRQKIGSQIELKPESKTKFFYGDGSDRQIEFKVDKSGKVEGAVFIYNGFKNEMKRL